LKSIAKNLLGIDLLEVKIAKERELERKMTPDEEIELFENEIKKMREQQDPQIIVGEEELSRAREIRNTINQFYRAMAGHPYFTSIQLEIEKEEPLIYSIKATGVDPAFSTRIPTRFSVTQMNVVALSLLLTNSEKIAKDFAVIMIDDPAQSMDKEHKEALAKVIQSLSQKKQVIVATQDSELRDALSNICREKLHSHEFRGWTTDGPSYIYL